MPAVIDHAPQSPTKSIEMICLLFHDYLPHVPHANLYLSSLYGYFVEENCFCAG